MQKKAVYFVANEPEVYMKRVLSIAGMLAAGGAGLYLYQLKKTGDSLLVKTKVQVHKVSFQNATLKATVNLRNRGNVDLLIQNLEVMLLYNTPTGQKPIIKSVPSKQEIRVKAGSDAEFTLMLETLPNLELIKLIGQTNFAKLKGSGLQLQANTKAKVNRFIPLSESEIISLKL